MSDGDDFEMRKYTALAVLQLASVLNNLRKDIQTIALAYAEGDETAEALHRGFEENVEACVLEQKETRE